MVLSWQSFSVLHVSETKVDGIWGMTLEALLRMHAHTCTYTYPQVTSAHRNTTAHKDKKHSIRSVLIHVSNASMKHWGLGERMFVDFPIPKRSKGQATKLPKLMPKLNATEKWNTLQQPSFFYLAWWAMPPGWMAAVQLTCSTTVPHSCGTRILNCSPPPPLKLVSPIVSHNGI